MHFASVAHCLFHCSVFTVLFVLPLYVFNKLCAKWCLTLGQIKLTFGNQVFLHFQRSCKHDMAVFFTCKILYWHTTCFQLADKTVIFSCFLCLQVLAYLTLCRNHMSTIPVSFMKWPFVYKQVSCCCSQCQSKMKINLCLNGFRLVTVNRKFYFQSVQNLSDDVKVTWIFSYFYLGVFEKVKNFYIFLS